MPATVPPGPRCFAASSRACPVDYVAIDQDGANRRSYPSFEAIADECAASRLWAGVHFSTANRVGTRLGRAIAERVFTVMLVPQRVR